MTRRRRTPAQRAKGYVCEWSCGLAFRDGRDYIAHVIAKHENGAAPFPKPAMIDLYRSGHVIVPVPAERPGLGTVTVCRTDGIRVHPIKGGHRHDIDEVRAASGVPAPVSV